MYQPAYSPSNGAPQQSFAVPHQRGFPQTSDGQTGAIKMPNGQNANLPRSVSMMSGSSAIIASAEEIRQRYKRTKPNNMADGEKDYKSIVQSLTTEKISAILKTKITRDGQCDKDGAGLKETQAREFRKVFGKNSLTPPVKKNACLRLLEAVFTGIFNLLLWACISVQVVLVFIDLTRGLKADLVTPILLAAVVVMAGVLQWHAEMSAESQMEALQKMQNDAKVSVVRRRDDGSRLDIELDPVDLVPGDVCFLSSGVKVPADVRIVYCTDGAEVDNSALTGESLPEPRKPIVEGDTCSSIDARNLAFFGTSILKGNLTCVVVATGDETYLGKIAQSIKSSRSISTLEVQIIHFVHIIAGVAIAVGVLSLLANIYSPTSRSFSEKLQNSFAALFAQVPEGLLPTVTISLMIASQEMFKRDVLVRKIDAVETLGCVTVFCSDKTGTLTKGEMTVQDFVIPTKSASSIAVDGLKVAARAGSEFRPDESLNEIVRCGILNNAAEVKVEAGQPVWTGSPTEKAILRACSELRGSVDDMKAMRLQPENNTLFEIPFNSENKWMLTVHGQQGGQATVVLKGAPDRVLTYCSVNSDEAAKAKIEKAMNDLMQQARRVLCIAKGTIQSQATWQGTNERDCNFQMRNLDFVGLFGIEDPPKEGVDTCVTQAQNAGVKVIMVTGDHPATARAIAKRINILHEGEGNEFTVITGAELEDKVPRGDNFNSEEDPEELGEWWEQATKHARVFARVSPIHKQVIVQAYQTFGCEGHGEICAMTGDGVNDAPALKQANVGVAMGERGTEVAKDAADIVLIDDEVASVIAGMEQGRLSSENLQKSIMYTLCSKLPQVTPTFAELFGVPSALTVAQVLLIDIGTDIWTAIAYACQPAESKLMERPPRHPTQEKLVNWKVLVYSYAYMGVMVTIFCWVMYFHTPGITELYESGRHSCIPPETGDLCFIAGDAETVDRGRTVYYWTLVMGQIAAAISTTTKFQSVFGYFGKPYCFPNTALNLMFVGEVVLGLLTIYTPFMQELFNATNLAIQTLLLPVLCIVVVCWIEEVRKLILRMCDPQEAQDAGSDSDFTDTSAAVSRGDDSSCSDSDSGKPLLC